MPAAYDLVFANGTIVNYDGMVARDVAVRGGKIVGLGAFDSSAAGRWLDCTGLHILPGVIDTQVHFREPGFEHKEDLNTGSRAAVMGGVTGVFEMPNTRPVTASPEALADKLRRAAGRMFCNYAFYVGGTRENTAMLGELERLPGCCGIKVFMGSSTGDLLVEDDAGLVAILANINRRAAFHSEDEARLRARLDERIAGDVKTHPVWRDEEVARLATDRLLLQARASGKQVHVLHVSTGKELALLAASKDIASVEVTPHHLTLSSPDAYERLGTRAQMNPPIRDTRQLNALWKALDDGVVDVLGSDHAPHTLDEKAKPYPDSPSGMTGVQTLVPIMLDHVNRGRLSLERFVSLTSQAPARLFKIAGKGRVAEGFDADLTIVDMNRVETITNQWIASRCGWTPYDGVEVKGWPLGTVVGGGITMWEGELQGVASGQPLRFL